VAELALDRGDVAGLLDQVLAHGVPGVVRGVASDLCELADLVPDGVDYVGAKSAVALGDGGRGTPVLIVVASLFYQVIPDGREPLARQ
jgi:hypothetical protein